MTIGNKFRKAVCCFLKTFKETVHEHIIYYHKSLFFANTLFYH